MRRRTLAILWCVTALAGVRVGAVGKTVVSIQGREFFINGRPTYEGRKYDGKKIQGLLLNSRMVQGIFDDRNPEPRELWKYPDGPWDPERNTREFIAAMPLWREKGLLAFTINFQGGSPQGYSKKQPWINSAFEWDGRLRDDYLARLARIIDRADELGMVVILGYFYQAQEQRMNDEAAVVRAADAATDWILSKGYTNVLVEVANEANHGGFKHEIIKPQKRANELIERVKEQSKGKVRSPAGRLLVSTSLGGGAVPPDSLVKVVDFVLVHGNGVKDPAKITTMVEKTRKLPSYHDQPILFNEDDHFNFDKPENNMLAAVSAYASWGYFDFRMEGEGFDEGYQSVPVNWGISSARKRGFFELVQKITGAGRADGAGREN